MSYAIVILSTIVMPVAMGWLYGKENIDPETFEGRVHYRS